MMHTETEEYWAQAWGSAWHRELLAAMGLSSREVVKVTANAALPRMLGFNKSPTIIGKTTSKPPAKSGGMTVDHQIAAVQSAGLSERVSMHLVLGDHANDDATFTAAVQEAKEIQSLSGFSMSAYAETFEGFEMQRYVDDHICAGYDLKTFRAAIINAAADVDRNISTTQRQAPEHSGDAGVKARQAHIDSLVAARKRRG